MPSVTIEKIRRIPATGRVYIRFSSGNEYEFSSLSEVQDIVRDELDERTLEAVALAMIMKRQPNLSNVAALEGRSVNVDLSVNNWGTVS